MVEYLHVLAKNKPYHPCSNINLPQYGRTNSFKAIVLLKVADICVHGLHVCAYWTFKGWMHDGIS